MAQERDWRRYEEQIRDRLVVAAGGDKEANVEFDARLPGQFSGIDRQVDVYVTGTFAGQVGRGTMAVDCKCFSRPVDVKDVETFIGLVEDVGTNFGLLVTTEGRSEAAENRCRGARGVSVEIVPYEELSRWEPEVLFCPACTDLESERAPGPLYLDPVPPETPGSDLATGMGRCWTCNALSMRCGCGALSTLTEPEEGSWIECVGGCGVEWRAEVSYDRKGMPDGEVIELRAAG